MRYTLSGTVMQTLAVDLDPGETVFQPDQLHVLDE